MPLYFFHVRTCGDLLLDKEGFEVADVAAAMHEAAIGARSLMGAEILEGTLRLDQSIEIHDAQGRHLRSIAFRDTVRIVPAEERSSVNTPRQIG